MSLDKSLVSKQRLVRHRNVLSRAERIEKLEEDDRWEEGQSLFGLPKVKNLKMKRRTKAEKKEEALEGAEVAAEGVEGAEAAAEGATPEQTEDSKDKKED